MLRRLSTILGLCLSFLFVGGLLSASCVALADTCCSCTHSCTSGDSGWDWTDCYHFCQNQGESFVNFHDDKDCSEIKACEEGACCDRTPECEEMTRLGCAIDAEGKGFLPGQTCEDCSEKTSRKSIKVSVDKTVRALDGSQQMQPYYLIVEISRLTSDAGFKGYFLLIPQSSASEAVPGPVGQAGDVEAERIGADDLTGEQWQELGALLYSLGLSPRSTALAEILDDVDADSGLAPASLRSVGLTSNTVIADPNGSFGTPLEFSHWEIRQETSGFTWTIVGPVTGVTVSTNDSSADLVISALYAEGVRSSPEAAHLVWYTSADSDESALTRAYPCGGLAAGTTLGGSVNMHFEGEDPSCPDGSWSLDGEQLTDTGSVNLLLQGTRTLTWTCSSAPGYASVIPSEIVDCARLLAWSSGFRHIGRISERWDAREFAPREACSTCGGAPMCVVCMEYDLGTYETRSGVASAQRTCQRNVDRYLRTATTQERQILAAIYWASYWDGRHNRNEPQD